jgi:Protein of unknown function (DUF3617)
MRRIHEAPAKSTIAAVLATIAGVAQASEWPAFSYGMWNFVRTIESAGGGARSSAHKKCMDPTDDLKKQHQMSTQAGCTVSPVTRAGNAYTFVTACKLQGQAVESKSTISVERDNAYRIRVESKVGGQTTIETLVATRSGDCF